MLDALRPRPAKATLDTKPSFEAPYADTGTISCESCCHTGRGLDVWKLTVCGDGQVTGFNHNAKESKPSGGQGDKGTSG